MKDFLKILLFAALFLAMFVFWASQCSAQTTFVRDRINTTTLTVLGSEKLFFSTDSTAPAAGYIKLWAQDSTHLWLIRSSGVKVNLLSSAIDTSILATQFDISTKADTSAVLYWPDTLSRLATQYDLSLVSGGNGDSTSWPATDYDVSLRLLKTDTASLSSRINAKLGPTDTVSLSNRINAKLGPSDTTSLSNRINLKLNATDTASLSIRINQKLGASDSTSIRNYSNSLYLGQSLIDTTGKALGAVLKWNGSKWVDSTDNTGAGGTLAWSDTSNALATDYDVSLKLNAAAIDTSKVLFWQDTTLANGPITDYGLPVTRTDTVTAALDTLLVTVSSVTTLLSATPIGTSVVPPIPVRFYRVNSTQYVIKFDYDLTANQPVQVTYWR